MKALNGSKKFLKILSKILIIVVLIIISSCNTVLPPPTTYSNLNQRKQFLQEIYNTSNVLKIQNFPYDCGGNDYQNENDYFVVVDSVGKAHYVELPDINPLTITSDYIINK